VESSTASEPVTASGWEQIRGPSLHLSSGVWAGIISGVLIGGLGGRIAMFLLRLTSDPSLHGLETDDGFVIGSFTGSTIFLLALCTAGGVLGGLFYLLIRSWLPRPYRVVVMAIFVGAAGGATVIKPDGIDFTLVEPHVLSIVLFIALPALYGYAVSVLTETFLARKEAHEKSWSALAVVPLLGLAILGPIGVIVVALTFAGWMLNLRFPVTHLWRSRWVTMVGRFVLVGITCMTLATLIADVGVIV